MKVWYCSEHHSLFQQEAEPNPPTWGCQWTEPGVDEGDDCVRVEMQLVPADALVIQKVNSEWPTLLIMELADLLAFERGDETVEYHEARRFFDSLLVASVSKAAT